MSVSRSLLFVPGNHRRRVEKAFTLGADAVILDLEDACPVSEKAASRDAVTTALRGNRRCSGYVRVNALSTEFAFADITAVVQAGLDGILLPKVERPADLYTADWLIGQLERERGLIAGTIELVPIVETAAGLAAIDDVARASPRVKYLVFGAGDFTLDLGIALTSDETGLLPYRSALVLASRAASLRAPVDTAWLELKDLAGLRRSAERARTLGFQGKLCIHPDQVPVVNQAFTLGTAEVDWAKRIVTAFSEAERQGSASFPLDGRFVDYAIVQRARQVLALAEHQKHQRKEG